MVYVTASERFIIMIKYSNEELCLIWLDSFIGLEPVHKQRLYSLIHGKTEIKRLIESGKDYIISNISESMYKTILSAATGEYLDFVIGGLERRGIKAVTVVSKEYPDNLKNIPTPPLVLYCKGDAGLLKSKSFGIVGSRKSMPLSLNLAADYTKTLIKAGFTMVTGNADGVDKAVLNAALENKGKVISVIAGGFDNVYPKSNALLVERVAENGLVITESPPEVVPLKFLFPVRNRIIAALPAGVLIVSGGIKSGTLYTAEFAEEYNKDVFVIPYSPMIASGAGCNDLLKRSKNIMLTDRPEDITDYYGIDIKENEKADLTPFETEILKSLSDGELHIDKICGAVGKRVYEVLPVLSMLEIKGLIVKNGTNVYAAAKNLED